MPKQSEDMMKKQYLRSTRNLYYKDEDGIRVFYSYTTPVAFIDSDNTLVVSENVWSMTTAKHLNWIEDFCGVERKQSRTKNSVFKESLKFRQSKDGQDMTEARQNNHLKTTAMVSKLFGLLSTNDEKAMEQKKRFFEIAGCTFPEDWDQLSLEEKRSRISKAEDFGIKD
tara:strand:+ start:772 stop:1278 length:507 start_codon:yes stop_codon:yes gene_type:complete